jgi:GntR family transcriptional regulator
MDTDCEGNIAHIVLDRNAEYPLHDQLRSALEMEIILGERKEGESLPSVRELATSLGVALVTVTRAYRELQQQGLVRSVPRRGYFVSVNPDDRLNCPSSEHIQGLVHHALKEARAAGLTSEEFIQIVHTEIRRFPVVNTIVAVLGERDAALDERVETVRDAVRDLGATVIGLSFSDIQTGTLPSEITVLDEVDWFLIPVGEAQQVREIVRDFRERIILMTRTLRADVRSFISAQPPETRFGVIAGRTSLIPRIMSVMRRYHPLIRSPIVTAVDQSQSDIEAVIQEADSFIIGSLAIELVRPLLDRSKPFTELIYVPDAETLNRVRQRIQQQR